MLFVFLKIFLKSLHITADYFKSSPGKAGVGGTLCFDFFLFGLAMLSIFIIDPFLSVIMVTLEIEFWDLFDSLLFSKEKEHYHRLHTHYVPRTELLCTFFNKPKWHFTIKVQGEAMERSLWISSDLRLCQKLKFRVGDPDLINVPTHVSTQHLPCRKFQLAIPAGLPYCKLSTKINRAIFYEIQFIRKFDALKMMECHIHWQSWKLQECLAQCMWKPKADLKFPVLEKRQWWRVAFESWISIPNLHSHGSSKPRFQARSKVSFAMSFKKCFYQRQNQNQTKN